MEDVSAWIAQYCDEILQVDDGGDATLAEALASKGVRVIGTDASRGFDAGFALQTFHPLNVLGVELRNETILEVLNCVSVERLFHIPAFEAELPRGWQAAVSEHGVILERCQAL